MPQEKIYPDGLMTFKKNEKQPDFVLGTLVITPSKLMEWCKKNESLMTEYKGEKQIRLQILSGKDGRVNLPVDTFKPKAKENPF